MPIEIKHKRVSSSTSKNTTKSRTARESKHVRVINSWNNWLKKKNSKLTDDQITLINKSIVSIVGSLASLVTVVLALLGGLGVI